MFEMDTCEGRCDGFDPTITTRVFKSGNSQAVRIPNDLWIAAYAMAMDLTLITK